MQCLRLCPPYKIRVSVAQISLPLAQPSLLVAYSQRIQILWRRSLVVDPLAQQRAAVDHVNGKLAVLVLVGEIAPERIVRIQAADRLEGERLQAPRLERLVIVASAFGVNLHAATQLADVLVKRRLEPAIAQAATTEPLRRQRLHVLDDAPRIDVGSAEYFQWARRAAPFRQRRALEHHGSRKGARHPQVRRVGAGIDPRALAERPAEAGRCVGQPALHLDDAIVDVELERLDEPGAELAEREPVPHRQWAGADKALPTRSQRQA